MVPTLLLYSTLDKWMPSLKYNHKMFLVGFITVHVPLLFSFLFVIYQPHISPWLLLAIVLIATIVGTLLAFWALWQLLLPVQMARQALQSFVSTGDIPNLPVDYRDEAGELMHDIITVTTSLKEQEHRLADMASHDFLTRMLNRRSAEETLKVLVNRHREQQESHFFIALLDIDHFKRVNDQYGHDIGDDVLRKVANLLIQHLRNGDDWAARWGGEEFIIVLSGTSEGVASALDRLRAVIATQTFTTSGQETFQLTVSIGFAQLQPNDQPQAVIKRADIAMYHAKHNGRNQLVAYQDLPFELKKPQVA